MPNWCYNYLQINVENNKQLEQVIQGITNNSEQQFDFNRIITMPEELESTKAPNKENPADLIAKYGFSDWYEWRVFNWGTKWNASEVEMTLEPTAIQIRFHTAWSPPTPVIKKIAEKFPFASITLNWEEESGYYGESGYTNGEMDYESDGEIDCAYRIKNWGDCHPDCENCGECDCELCDCPNRALQTICESCNEGTHNGNERKDDEESQTATESALSTTEESN